MLELHGAADVIDVSVRNHDLFHLELVASDDLHDRIDVVTRIDDHGFAAVLVAYDGAIALQRANRQNFVNHVFIIPDIIPDKASSRLKPSPKAASGVIRLSTRKQPR